MKKILAMMLTAAMMLSMGTAAFADLPADPDDTVYIDGITLKTEKKNDNGVEIEECISVHLVNTPADYSVVLLDANGNALTTVTPLAEPEYDVTEVAKIDCKIILGNGMSGSWSQTAYDPKDDVVPAAIAMYAADDTLLDVYTITENDFSADEWAALDATTSVKAKQDKPANFNKTYIINNGTSPKDTFNFKFDFVGYSYDGEADTTVTGPAIDNASVDFESLTANANGVVEVKLDGYTFPEIGVYTYEVTEIIPEGTTTDLKTAGVTYAENEKLYLVVTVYLDEEHGDHYVGAVHYETKDGAKTGAIVNKYDAGSLEITKEITGNMADMDKEFEFTVTFTPETGDEFDTSVQIVKDETSVATDYDASAGDNGTYVVTFKLGDGDTVRINNIPENTTYVIAEDADGYEKSTKDSTATGVTKADGKIEANDKDAIIYVNNLDNNIDTGISVDSIPYIAMLGVVAVGGAGFMVSKKRRSED